jgi:hypothetical protein
VLLSLGLSTRILVAENWFASPTDLSQKLSVPSFLRHSFGCFVRCMLVGYLSVSLGFAYLTAFSGPFKEVGSFMTHYLLFVCTLSLSSIRS